MIIDEYLWHIHIGDSTMSLSMFHNFCKNVLTLIGGRIVSLRLRLTNVIGGWSIISSSFRYHQTRLLQHLHLIDIKPDEFDKLLSSPLIKQLHTLLVDVKQNSLFKQQTVEGVYLTKACSKLPRLTICRLPFDICTKERNELGKYSTIIEISLPNILNTTHLRRLTIGMNTSYFLERLLLLIPFIEHLSIGVKDPDIKENDRINIIRLPVAVQPDRLLYLSRLSIDCANNNSFHRAISLLSSVFNRITHFSLKFEGYSYLSDPLIISVPFINQRRPKVFIQETNHFNIGEIPHSFMVYTLPYNDKIFSSSLLTKDLEIYSQMSVNALDLFQHTDQLLLNGFVGNNYFSDLANCRSSISSLVPWTQISKVFVCGTDFIKSGTLESILRMASNVHTLEIWDVDGTLPRAILRNKNDVGTRINEQIESLKIVDFTMELSRTERFCTRLYNQLPNLKTISFCIRYSDRLEEIQSSSITDDKNESTNGIIKIMHFLVDHFKQLVSIDIQFIEKSSFMSPYYPHLIRKQIYEKPLSRPNRVQCYHETIQIWL
ncbi:unnamed protein product [Rotaria sordida]|uniref:Uncharacterized protein n=1 Tax=Rotaria sordida TaxID=392033 RepID=A0A818ZTC0_9BILA|nr:unnamed protein product [Rotaria sordida]CAF3830283.1 unnamed protein product [Rotaria sordida]